MAGIPDGPAATAARDQLAAAERDNLRDLDALAEQFGGAIQWGDVSTRAGRFVRDLKAHARDRELTACPHVGLGRLMMSFAHPDRVMCPQCFVPVAYARVSDPTCDLCREPSALYTDVVAVLGPITVTGSLCPACTEPSAE